MKTRYPVVKNFKISRFQRVESINKETFVTIMEKVTNEGRKLMAFWQFDIFLLTVIQLALSAKLFRNERQPGDVLLITLGHGSIDNP